MELDHTERCCEKMKRGSIVTNYWRKEVASPIDGDGRLLFRAYQGSQGLEHLAAAWTALAESLPDAGFVHFPEWYRAYLSAQRCDPGRIWFIAAYRNQEMIAVFPLQFHTYRGQRSWLRILGTIDDDELQCSDFVFQAGADRGALLYEVVRWLRTQRDLQWDELRLRKISETSTIANAARFRLPRATVTLRHDSSAYFDVRGTYEQATNSISGTFKRNLRRLSHRAEESAPLRYQPCQRREQLGDAFDTFLDIEASGWKGEAGTFSAIRCQPAMLALYRNLMQEFSARNACVVNLLWHGDNAVAGQFCMKIGRTLSILKIGFRNEHASFAPGNLLLERTIRHACGDPEIDFLSLINDPPWARNFKPLSTGVWSYYAPNWTLRGWLVHLGLLAKRKWDACRSRSVSVVTGTVERTTVL
jgi:CelD/BcsL family acetyltransferase involved in cellulose biosynthesis